MFLHGGGWRRGRRSDEKCGIFQPCLIARGCLFALFFGGGVRLYIYIYYICVSTPFHEVSVSTLRVCISWTLTGSRRSNIFHFFQNVGLVFGASVD